MTGTDIAASLPASSVPAVALHVQSFQTRSGKQRCVPVRPPAQLQLRV
jgi:hypothetical protein